MSDNRKLYSLLDTLRRTAVFTGNVALEIGRAHV